MYFSEDMREFLEILEQRGVEYVLVGGHAVNFYGYMRTTQAIDVLVFPSVENADRVMDSLADFGFGGAGIPRALFERPGSVVHLGVEPNRIDLLTHLKGVGNDRIFANKQRVDLAGSSVYMISFEDLLDVKRSSDRPRDRADAEELEKSIGER